MTRIILSSLIPFFVWISEIAARFELNPVLVASQVRAESSFNPAARSHVGALGLMQVMPKTAKWLGFLKSEKEAKKLLNPQFNLLVGCFFDRWLRKYWAKRGWRGIELDLLMLASYNAGPGRAKRSLRKGRIEFEHLPRETKGYVRRIFSFQALYLFKAAKELAR